MIKQLDNPYQCFLAYAPTDLMEITTLFYKTVEKTRSELFPKAIDNDAFGNKIAFCYYRKLFMIDTLFSIIFLIYQEKIDQLKLYDLGIIQEVPGDLYYSKKYDIQSKVKFYHCLGIDVKKVFNAVNFDGNAYQDGIGYMYIDPSQFNPIFKIS